MSSGVLAPAAGGRGSVDPVRVAQALAAGIASAAPGPSQQQLSRMEQARRDAARHKATLAAATRAQEEAQRKEDDRLARWVARRVGAVCAGGCWHPFCCGLLLLQLQRAAS